MESRKLGVTVSEGYSQCLLCNSRKAKICLIPLQEPAAFAQSSQNFSCSFFLGRRECLTLLFHCQLKNPAEKWPTMRVLRTGKATVAPYLGLSCLSGGPNLSPEAQANHSQRPADHWQASGQPHTLVQCFMEHSLWARFLK